MAYSKLEPFGAARDNFHSATIAALLHNINRKKGSPPVTAQDYMYEDEGTRERRRVEDIDKAFAGFGEVISG